MAFSTLDTQSLIRDSTFCSMVHATRQLTATISPELAEIGLSPEEYYVLGALLGEPGCTPAELARNCGVSAQHVSGMLDRLEERGLVRREGERGRGRRTQVSVTGEGVALLEAGWPLVHGAGVSYLAPVQHAMLRTLLESLRESSGDRADVVVLVDEKGEDCGTAPRLEVHTTDTPLHRAFSTYLRDQRGRVLITRRALHKKTWPGVWTNAACGHLLPGETHEQAALRRVPGELGTSPKNLRMALPDFRYRATDASGIVENELCPVMVGEIDAYALAVNPDEVAEYAWVDWADLRATARTMPNVLSPWCITQIDQLGENPWDGS